MSRTFAARRSGTKVVVLLLVCTPLIAWQPVAVHPSPDSTELYISFFFFQEEFARWTAERIASEPSHKEQYIKSAARYLGIAPAEFETLETIAAEVATQMRSVGVEARSYVQSSARTAAGVDDSILTSYGGRREVIIKAGVARMRQRFHPVVGPDCAGILTIITACMS